MEQRPANNPSILSFFIVTKRKVLERTVSGSERSLEAIYIWIMPLEMQLSRFGESQLDFKSWNIFIYSSNSNYAAVCLCTTIVFLLLVIRRLSYGSTSASTEKGKLYFSSIKSALLRKPQRSVNFSSCTLQSPIVRLRTRSPKDFLLVSLFSSVILKHF